MSDIVERLRAVNQDVTQPWKLCEEAAAEIERLRAVAKHLGKLASARRDALEAKLSKAVEALEEIRDMPIMVPLDVYELASATLKEIRRRG